MEEKKQRFWHIMPYYFKKGKTQLKCETKLCSVWKRCCDWSNMSKVICAGDFSLDDAAWLGRPVEIDSDQIETLIENGVRSCGR